MFHTAEERQVKPNLVFQSVSASSAVEGVFVEIIFGFTLRICFFLKLNGSNGMRNKRT